MIFDLVIFWEMQEFLTTQARREHQLALLMFKVKNKMLPNHLTEIFTNTNPMHNHNTRNSDFNFA
jgi:hypothetical protein